MYKMVLKITNETWKKCGIKIIKHYNEKEDIIELWNKMSDIEIQLKYSNIYDIALKRIKKYYGKKSKQITEEEKENIKHFLKVKELFSLLKNLHVI